jgi:hypothetical protein
VRVSKLVPPLAHAYALLQNPIHRAHRALVAPFIEELRVHLRGSLVRETFRIERLEYLRPFGFGQRRRRARAASWPLLWPALAIVRGARGPQGFASRLDAAKVSGGVQHRNHQLSSFKSSGRFCSTPKSSDFFFYLDDLRGAAKLMLESRYLLAKRQHLGVRLRLRLRAASEVPAL